jgi:hypothetical protein
VTADRPVVTGANNNVEESRCWVRCEGHRSCQVGIEAKACRTELDRSGEVVRQEGNRCRKSSEEAANGKEQGEDDCVLEELWNSRKNTTSSSEGSKFDC